MSRPVRVILGVVAGVVVSSLLVFCVEALNLVLFPLPPGADYRNPEAMKAAIAVMPPAAFGIVLTGWALGALLGVFTTTKITRSPMIGLIVGVILLTAAIMNMLAFPHPAWFWGAAIVLYVVFTWIGTRLGAPRGPAIPPAAPAQA